MKENIKAIEPQENKPSKEAFNKQLSELQKERRQAKTTSKAE